MHTTFRWEGLPDVTAYFDVAFVCTRTGVEIGDCRLERLALRVRVGDLLIFWEPDPQDANSRHVASGLEGALENDTQGWADLGAHCWHAWHSQTRSRGSRSFRTGFKVMTG